MKIQITISEDERIILNEESAAGFRKDGEMTEAGVACEVGFVSAVRRAVLAANEERGVLHQADITPHPTIRYTDGISVQLRSSATIETA